MVGALRTDIPRRLEISDAHAHAHATLLMFGEISLLFCSAHITCRGLHGSARC